MVALAGAIVASVEPVQGQIRVNPTGVNVNSQGASTVFLAFAGLANEYRPVEAFWCGAVVSAAPDIGARCDPATVYGRLPLRYDLSSTDGDSFTDIMSIPASVARRAYDAAARGEHSAFFYVRRFAAGPGQRDQYVSVTCRMAGGGARVPLALTEVRLSFDGNAPVLFVASGSRPRGVSAQLTYNGTGRLIGRWEIVRPGDDMPEPRDLLTEATLPPAERGTQRRYEELSRFNVFLPPTGRATLPGPDASRLPAAGEGTYLILLRIEASDDKEGDVNLGAIGAGSGVLHNGAVAGFPIPTLRYVVGAGADVSSPDPGPGLRLLAPPTDARIAPGLLFAWSEHPQAAFYHLEIESVEGERIFSAYVAKESRNYRPPSWLSERVAGRSLQWRVAALDAEGHSMGRSAFRAISAKP
jgi:hypothetical protein